MPHPVGTVLFWNEVLPMHLTRDLYDTSNGTNPETSLQGLSHSKGLDVESDQILKLQVHGTTSKIPV
jgi:hypothetical protein